MIHGNLDQLKELLNDEVLNEYVERIFGTAKEYNTENQTNTETELTKEAA